MTNITSPPPITCACGAQVKALSSYFGIPLHFNGTTYRVCPKWSGISRKAP